MSETDDSSTHFEWGSPEVELLITKQHEEDLWAGIYKHYLFVVDNQHYRDEVTKQLFQYSYKANYPLLPQIGINYNEATYYIARIDTLTGNQPISKDTTMQLGSAIEVCVTDKDTSNILRLENGFSKTQAELVILHAQELIQLGLSLEYLAIDLE